MPTAVSTSGEAAAESRTRRDVAQLLARRGQPGAGGIGQVAGLLEAFGARWPTISWALSETGGRTTHTPMATARQPTMPMTPTIVANQPRIRIRTHSNYVSWSIGPARPRAAAMRSAAGRRSGSRAAADRGVSRPAAGRPPPPLSASRRSAIGDRRLRADGLDEPHAVAQLCRACQQRPGQQRAGLAVRLQQRRAARRRARRRPSALADHGPQPRPAHRAGIGARRCAVPVGSQRYARPPVMPAPKLGPMPPRMTTTPPVMYSQPWAPTPSTTADAPLLRTANRMPARPTRCSRPPVAPYRQALPAMASSAARSSERRPPAGPRPCRPTGPCPRSRWPGRPAPADTSWLEKAPKLWPAAPARRQRTGRRTRARSMRPEVWAPNERSAVVMVAAMPSGSGSWPPTGCSTPGTVGSVLDVRQVHVRVREPGLGRGRRLALHLEARPARDRRDGQLLGVQAGAPSRRSRSKVRSRSVAGRSRLASPTISARLPRPRRDSSERTSSAMAVK